MICIHGWSTPDICDHIDCSGGRRRVFVPASVDGWLDAVEDIPEADLPCNVSTVAYAVNAAALYRKAYRHMLDAFNEAVSGVESHD